jgi:hypothetical protein
MHQRHQRRGRTTRIDGQGSACALPRKLASWRPSPGRDRRHRRPPARRWRTRTSRTPRLVASRAAHPSSGLPDVPSAPGPDGRVAGPTPPHVGSWCARSHHRFAPPFLSLRETFRPNKNRPWPKRRSVDHQWGTRERSVQDGQRGRLVEGLPRVPGKSAHPIEFAFPLLLPFYGLRRHPQHASYDQTAQAREPELTAPAAQRRGLQ